MKKGCPGAPILQTDASWVKCQERLQSVLKIKGFVTVLSGPGSVCRKLCREVFGTDMITINCREAMNPYLFWQQADRNTYVPASDMGDRQNYGNVQLHLLKESVLSYCIEHDKVLIVEGFRFACKEMRVYMAQQFKDIVRRGIRVVILLHDRQVDMLLQANPDLQGRISVVGVGKDGDA